MSEQEQHICPLCKSIGIIDSDSFEQHTLLECSACGTVSCVDVFSVWYYKKEDGTYVVLPSIKWRVFSSIFSKTGAEQIRAILELVVISVINARKENLIPVT